MDEKLAGLYSRNFIRQVAEADRAQLYDYIQVTESLSKLTYQSIYIIDYEKMAFDFVSENPLFLCGHTAGEVMQLGYGFYLKNVPDADLQLLNAINECGFDFYDGIPLAEKKDYVISYDFNLIDASGKKILVNHQLTPLFLTREGKLWKSLCLVSISGRKQPGNVMISKFGSDATWELNLTGRTWVKTLKPKLSQKEVEVLRLYAQGMKIGQMADRLHCTPDTVKYYRKKIFEKLGVKNMHEALSWAVGLRLV